MPVMGQFPGPNSVLVLDNAQVHHGGRVQEICEAAGVLVVYLPPYSPDMNPIEKVFSVLKNRLKRAQILTGTDRDAQIVMDFLPGMVTPQLMRQLYLGSGYSA
jgi:transposase